jgi:hypothetical protein
MPLLLLAALLVSFVSSLESEDIDPCHACRDLTVRFVQVRCFSTVEIW